ncbi:MAG: M23 family metallopeptidase [Bdellovibrionales bacterium]|nr:M23 family metallopeptidase [Bdellovibrionales bacterium]
MKLWLALTIGVAVLVVGTSFSPAFADPISNSVVFPVMAPRLTSSFGMRNHPVRKRVRHHSGVDLAAPMGSHVRAISGGRVVFAGNYGGYGKLVTVLHRGGYSSLYGHLSDILVNVGQTLRPGDIVGRVGQSGLATGPHLHFEWRKDGRPLDPLKTFPELAADAEG